MSSDKETLREATEACARLRETLVDTVDPVDRKPGGKIRHLAIVLREVLLHRAVDLADAACTLYREGRLVPAATLTRALSETTAAIYYGQVPVRD